MSIHDDLLAARELLTRHNRYEPNPPMPAELQLLLREFGAMSELLTEIRAVVNRWADRDDITDQAAQLTAELLLALHNGGWSS